MRKLILIAVIATMSSTACHANLSLASNEPAQQITAPSAPALDAKAEAPIKPAHVSRPKRRQPSDRGYVIRSSYGHCL